MLLIQPLEQFAILVGKKIFFFTFFLFSINSINSSFLQISIGWLFILYIFIIYTTYSGTYYDLFFYDIIFIFYSWLSRQFRLIHGRFYFVLLFTIFLFILYSNFIGLLPYNFTLTGQFYITFLLSFFLVFGIIYLGIYIYKINFLKLFLPKSISNYYLFIFITVIEIISYCIRPFSLAIRLFANMLAGHTLLYILGNFSVNLYFTYIVFIVFLSFLIIFFIFCLEIAIAFIQAYVFIILVIIYLNDIYNLKH